jgi:hypothetical protein
MDPIKPINIDTRSNKLNHNERLTSAEISKLWAMYTGNNLANCVLSYFLRHIEDEEIKKVVENGLSLTEQFMATIKEIYHQVNFPIPVAFSEDDVNLEAPRLFYDEFYLHYLKYVAKSGISIYAIAIPLMIRKDVRDFFMEALNSTMELMSQINDTLQLKGHLIKPPYIPIPKKIEFVKKQSYIKGFLGDVRPLNGLEITHLFDNLQNNETSKSLLIGFSQVAQLPQVKDFLVKGKDLSTKHIVKCTKLLREEDLHSSLLLDDLVTTSTIPPFSDKLMLAHKLDTFTMRVRAYGNSAAVTARQDIGVMYAQFMLDVGNYAKEGAGIMIEHGWLEEPPKAADRNELSGQS